MKALIRSVLFAGALAIGANGLIAAQANDHSFDQWYKAKYGRSSPAEEARLKVERESTAFREETGTHIQPAGPNWAEQYFQAKYGRNIPAEESRLKAERENSAFREESDREAVPARAWSEEWQRAKYGRYPGK